MLRKRLYREISEGSAEINLAPLIDMVFILLIFFLVNSTFVNETGVDVQRPSAKVAESLSRESVFVGIEGDGSIHMNRQEIGILSVRARVREQLQLRQVPVVIIPDKETRADIIMDVIDECKLAGAEKISLAAEKE